MARKPAATYQDHLRMPVLIGTARSAVMDILVAANRHYNKGHMVLAKIDQVRQALDDAFYEEEIVGESPYVDDEGPNPNTGGSTLPETIG